MRVFTGLLGPRWILSLRQSYPRRSEVSIKASHDSTSSERQGSRASTFSSK